MIRGTAFPSSRCCSTNSSIIVYALPLCLCVSVVHPSANYHRGTQTQSLFSIMQSGPQSFEQALIANAPAFGVELLPEALARLGAYYSLLARWNERLHLVAPCTPEEFGTRHVLESLLLLKHLPHGAKIADIGSGGGLPIIPCLSVREDLDATLIEASQKNAVFLRAA